MKKLLLGMAMATSLVATQVFALTGFLEGERTNGSVKYCYYSNDVIITIKSYKLCPLSIN